MTPDTEKNINEAIDWLQQTGGQIQDFAVEQAPLYCREVVAWTLWSSIAQLAFCIVIVAAVVVLLWRNREAIMDSFEEMEIVWTLVAIFSVIAGIMATVNGCIAASSAIKAAVAPRLVIVEHLRGLKD